MAALSLQIERNLKVATNLKVVVDVAAVAVADQVAEHKVVMNFASQRLVL